MPPHAARASGGSKEPTTSSSSSWISYRKEFLKKKGTRSRISVLKLYTHSVNLYTHSVKLYTHRVCVHSTGAQKYRYRSGFSYHNDEDPPTTPMNYSTSNTYAYHWADRSNLTRVRFLQVLYSKVPKPKSGSKVFQHAHWILDRGYSCTSTRVLNFSTMCMYQLYYSKFTM